METNNIAVIGTLSGLPTMSAKFGSFMPTITTAPSASKNATPSHQLKTYRRNLSSSNSPPAASKKLSFGVANKLATDLNASNNAL